MKIIRSAKIKDGDKITLAMAKKFTGYVRDFMPMNSTFSYDLRRLVIEKGIGVSFTETPTSQYELIVDENRLDELYEIMARTCRYFDKEMIEKNLHRRDTKDFIGCRVYY